MRWLMVLGALAFSAAVAPGAAAQRELGEDEARRSIPHYEAVKEAATRGREMYLYDQAAWHATDRFLEEFDRGKTSMMRGYLILPRDDDRLDAVFYGEVDGTLVEVARYTVAGSKVEEGAILPEDARPPLSALALRMADAQTAAAKEMLLRDYRLCAATRANTIVLPPAADGAIAVYLLTPPTSNDSYPMGGHYKFEIGRDGKVSGSRRFMNTCLDAPLGSAGAPAGSTLQVFGLVHLLDPHPTEIHVFVSHYMPVMLMVTTAENEQTWSVRQGSVGHVGDLDRASGQAGSRSSRRRASSRERESSR